MGDLEDGGFGFEKGHQVERSVFQGSVEDTAYVEVDIVRSLFDEDETDCKEGGKDDTHGGSSFDFPKPGDPLGKEGGEDACDGGAEKHPPTGARSRDEEGNGEAGENGVADGIAHHTHPAQEKKGPGKGTRHGA